MKRIGKPISVTLTDEQRHWVCAQANKRKVPICQFIRSIIDNAIAVELGRRNSSQTE